jgi:hypothetical protein
VWCVHFAALLLLLMHAPCMRWLAAPTSSFTTSAPSTSPVSRVLANAAAQQEPHACST